MHAARRLTVPHPLAARAMSAAPSWFPADAASAQRVAEQAMTLNLARHYNTAAKSLVTWFVGAMPTSYFRETSMEVGIDHLKAIDRCPHSGFRASSVHSRLPNGTQELSYLRPADVENTADRLSELISGLPAEAQQTLQRVKVFTSNDRQLQIFSFQHGAPAPAVELSQFLRDGGGGGGGGGPTGGSAALLRNYVNPENINHYLTLRHKQCRLGNGGITDDHGSIFIERKTAPGTAENLYGFYGAFSNVGTGAVAAAIADQVALDSARIHSFHLDRVADSERGTNMLFMEVGTCPSNEDAADCYKAAQRTRWQIIRKVQILRGGGGSADLPEPQAAAA